MSEQELRQELETLRQQIAEQAKTRSRFEGLTALGAISTPIVVALVGGYFAFAQSQHELQSKGMEVTSALETATQDRWLEQAKFAHGLMGDFLGADESRAKMALELVAHSDSNLGSRISRIVSEISPRTAVGQFAAVRTTQLKDQLIRQLVHETKDIRWNAAEGLLAHGDDPTLVSDLISFAKEDPQAKTRTGGAQWRVYNVMTVLVDLARTQPGLLANDRPAVLSFADWAAQNDPRTAKLVSELKSRLS